MITTVLVWLLVSLPTDYDKNRKPAVTVERFATVEECERVKKVISDSSTFRPEMRCIQANIAIVR